MRDQHFPPNALPDATAKRPVLEIRSTFGRFTNGFFWPRSLLLANDHSFAYKRELAARFFARYPSGSCS